MSVQQELMEATMSKQTARSSDVIVFGKAGIRELLPSSRPRISSPNANGRTFGEKHPAGAILSPAAPVVVAFRKASSCGVTQADLAEEREAALLANRLLDEAEAAGDRLRALQARLQEKIERGASVEPGPLQISVKTVSRVFVETKKGRTRA
jgi:hypothetical protein